MVFSKAAGDRGGSSLSLIRGIRDMAALADVRVDFRSWQDIISSRSKTVKHFFDLLKERYPNARGYNVFVASNVLRTGCVPSEILDELVEGAVSQVMYPANK